VNRRAVHFPIFTDPRDAVRALAWNREFHARRPIALGSHRPQWVDSARARAQLDECGDGPVPPSKLASVLAAYGISLIPWALAVDEEGAVREARILGYPLVMKTAQPEVIHKSDIGAVLMGIMEESAVRDAYGRLASLGTEVMLQRMAEPGLEWFVGGRQDPNFGPVVVTGAGGIYVELLGETSLRVGPVAEEEVQSMLDQLRGASLLSGIRGQTILDRPGLTDLIVRVSWLLTDFPEIQELDLNPVRIFCNRCLALDWRATLSRRFS
jgi:acetate---CoA ligase (ADP-forming)